MFDLVPASFTNTNATCNDGGDGSLPVAVDCMADSQDMRCWSCQFMNHPPRKVCFPKCGEWPMMQFCAGGDDVTTVLSNNKKTVYLDLIFKTDFECTVSKTRKQHRNLVPPFQ